MKVSPVAPLPRSAFFSLALCLSAAFAFAAPPVLKWNGTSGGLWDADTANWLDAGDNAVVWQPGAEARFEGAGGTVNVAADLLVSNITFAASGYTLLGSGRLTVEGALSSAAAATNSIATDMLTIGGLAKTGAGAVALARCSGPLAVQGGSLLASGTLFSDADLSVASNASVITLGEPAAASNLILNPGFELPAMSSGSYQYVGGGNVISNWTVTARPDMVARENTVFGNAWNSAGASPEGVHMLILQYNGTVAQTVTVPADGLYSVAFSHLLRNGYGDAQVYVSLDGLPLATFLNRSVQFNPGRFVSGALWLKAGAHAVGIGGEGAWGDRSSMIDAVCVAPPSSGSACRAFSGDSVLKAAAGASVRFDHSGTITNVYVSINGTAASGTFDASHASGIFSGSGALSCAASGSVFTWAGSGLWSEAGRWADGAAPAAGGDRNLLVRFPSAAGNASTNDLAETFLARRFWAAGLAADSAAKLAGNPLALTNDASGAAPKISLAAPGAVTVSAPVTARSSLTLDSAGTLTFSDYALTVPNGSTLTKLGCGTVTVPTFTNTVANAYVYEGAVQTPSLPSSAAVSLLSQSGRASALCLTRSGSTTLGNTLNLMGSGTPTLATRCGGGTVTFSNWTYGYSDAAVFDVGANDILSLRQILLTYLSTGVKVSATALTKTGPGTLELRSMGADSGNNRAFQGATTLRNGTLSLSEDDCGTLNTYTNPFNGRVYSGTGGSLGYSSFTNTVRIGDSATSPSDTLTLTANGAGRWIGHALEVNNRGASVTLAMTTGTVMFAGTVTLHRDITLAGPANGVMVFSNVVAAADFSGTGSPAFSGLAGLRIDGSFPSEASLRMDGRLLSFGTYAVKAQTLNALVLGSAGAAGTLNVDFGAGANDTITVAQSGGLVLSNTVVNLYCAGTGLPFAEPGVYTLFTYAGALGGDAALLSVGNPQAGASYAFSNDTASARVLLTISNTSGGTSAIWKSTTGGDWATGSNWDSGSAPGGAGVSVLFGLAITGPATVAIGTGRTVGGLAFNNAANSYTLSGGSLTLDNGGPAPVLSVSSGSHTIDTTVNGSAGLSVATASDAALVLGGGAAVNTPLSLSQGTLELRGAAAVNASATLAASTTLRAASTNGRVGTLTGPASATLALADAATSLTVNQTSSGTFSGVIRGTAGTLVKDGAATLTLDNPGSVYSGRTEVASGTLALRSATLNGATAVGASAELAVLTSPTNGLTGFYYTIAPNTNAFWTLAGMEAHFATLRPDLASPSGLAGASFDFTTAGTLFPLPYGAGGTRTSNFEAVFRGTITVPESGVYWFGAQGDDGFLLALDGQTVLGRNRSVAGWLDGAIRLEAGRHDIVLGYFQLTGSYGLQLRVRPPSANASYLVPNAWLTPYATSGLLTGGGALSFAASNALLRAEQNSVSTFSGNLSGAPGSLLAKSGNGVFDMASGGAANAFGGDVDAQAGTLALSAIERIADASTLSVRPGATLAVTGSETVGALSGGGTLALGGYVYLATFAGDADCDISSSKTYTHLLDFPANGSPATVNGVLFTDAGMTGSAGGYAWATSGNVPTGGWTNSPLTGMTHLLEDFIYGTTNYTLTLSGLATNTAYEMRLYFRNFANNPRTMTLFFTAGSRAIGSYTFNPDAAGLARCWVGCRYATDAAGTFSIRVASNNATDTPHLYGLSNESAAGQGTPCLTVAPGAGRLARFTGSVSGNGSLVKAGAGTQRFGGANTLPAPTAVTAGTALFEPGASVSAGVALSAGATAETSLGNVTLGGLTGEGTLALGNNPTNSGPYFVKITGDADCGISRDKTYTHLLDFGTNMGARAVVNGVSFDKCFATSGTYFSYGWSGIPGATHAGGNTGNIGVPPSQGIFNLLNDFNYGTTTGTVYLAGLTVGKRYELRIYHRCWSYGTDRSTRLVFDPDGPGPLSEGITFNPDAVRSNENYLAYQYVAGSNTFALTIQSLKIDRYHIYGLSNEEAYDSLNSPVTLAVAGSDVFGGAVTGIGAWAKTGSGSLTITGESTATGPLAVSAGAFGVAGGGRATAGAVSVAAGATLFGDGRMGGSVSIASNAWLHAGTPGACGTLQVAGDLTLAAGALPKFRFAASGQADAITVGGLLTFPTNGVVLAEALTEGVKPPAKAALFTSTQAISGPAELTGWTVAGEANCSLTYSGDRKTIYIRCPRGTMLLLR